MLFHPSQDVAFAYHLTLLYTGVDERSGLFHLDGHQGVGGLDDAEGVTLLVGATRRRRRGAVVLCLLGRRALYGPGLLHRMYFCGFLFCLSAQVRF